MSSDSFDMPPHKNRLPGVVVLCVVALQSDCNETLKERSVRLLLFCLLLSAIWAKEGSETNAYSLDASFQYYSSDETK